MMRNWWAAAVLGLGVLAGCSQPTAPRLHIVEHYAAACEVLHLELVRSELLESSLQPLETRNREEQEMYAQSARDVQIARDYVDFLKPRYEAWVKSQIPPKWSADWPASLIAPP